MSVAYLAVGSALVTIGFSAMLLAAAFWSRSGPTLATFGLFTLLYGARSLALVPEVRAIAGLSPQAAAWVIWLVNYWMPLPALIYMEQLRGAGWLNAVRRMWQAWIVVGLGFTAADLILRRAGSFGAAYGVWVILMLGVLLVVIMLRRDVRDADRVAVRVGALALLGASLYDNLAGLLWPDVGVRLELFGITTLLVSLGFVTGRQFFARERELAVVEHEMRTARRIQESILPASALSLPGLQIAARYLPMRGIAGDLYDFHVVDDHRVGVLVADVTGHGVPAALVASMVKVAFTAQRDAATQPGALLAGMNRALCGNLTAQFVTAAYLFFDAELGEVRYSVAGHPPPILWRSRTKQRIDLADAHGIFLGFDRSATYSDGRLALAPGDRVLIYTDGLVEAQNAAGEFFGETRLPDGFAPHEREAPEDFAGRLIADLAAWSGRSVDGPFDDDLTLVVVDIRPVATSARPSA